MAKVRNGRASGSGDEGDPEDVVTTMILLMDRQLQKLYGKISARQLRLMRAQLEIFQAEILAMPTGAWSEARRQAVIVMIARGMAKLTNTSLAQMVRDLGLVSLESRNAMLTYLTTLDRTFTGVTTPLNFASLAWWEEANANVGRTRIRQYTRSWQRYGSTVTLAIEDALARKILIGQSWDRARDEVWAVTRHVVGDKQWMVDRILKTEMSAAWNGTALAAMIAEDDDPDDPMMKKLVSTFDDVTGHDSVQLHGQTRLVEKPFYDRVNQITYMAPPNRPHDREIVVPWRKSYGDEFSDYTRETADGYDPKVHGRRKRLEGERKTSKIIGMRTRRPIRNDPTRPSTTDRMAQLQALRAQRRVAVAELRQTRETVDKMQRRPNPDANELRQLVNRRNLLRRKVEEHSTWIASIQAM